MATIKQAGLIYGGQHLSKGINELLEMLDKYTGKAAAPILEKPSTWITIAASIGLPAAAILFKLKDPYDKIALIIGGYLSTNLWDIVSALTATATATTAAPVYTPAEIAPPVTTITQAPTF